jgi:hypothetical protein
MHEGMFMHSYFETFFAAISRLPDLLMEEVPDTHYQLTNKTQGFVQMSINLVLEMGYGAQTHMLCEVCVKKTTVLTNLNIQSPNMY